MNTGYKVDIGRVTADTDLLNIRNRRVGSGSRFRTLPRKDRPRIVLLQGPVGPFFKTLQTYLERNGFDAWRVVFNAGDQLFSNRMKRISYQGSRRDWTLWFANLLSSSDVDHLIVFGCEREVHRSAIELARRAGVHVLSLEEGYIRPGFVTVEENGNNRRSPLAGKLPPMDNTELKTTAVGDNFQSFKNMCCYGFAYYATRNMFTSLRRRELFHKHRILVAEGFYWARNGFRRVVHTSHNFSKIQYLLEHQDKKYFIIPLQVYDDLQLRAASNSWSNEKLIMAAAQSFAKFAPQTHRLVFKIHPLERGHTNHHEMIRLAAELNKISNRVDVVDAGSLGLLVRHSAGMLTINSTSGLSAIAHGVPLLVVAEAIYSHPELAHCGQGKPDFDSFWSSKHVADSRLRRRYLNWIQENCLVRGDFYTVKGREQVCKGVLAKLKPMHENLVLKPCSQDILPGMISVF